MGNPVENPRLGTGPGLREAGQVHLKQGQLRPEGAPLIGVRSCVPKARIGLWTMDIRIAVRKEVITLQTPGVGWFAGSLRKPALHSAGRLWVSTLAGPQTISVDKL